MYCSHYSQHQVTNHFCKILENIKELHKTSVVIVSLILGNFLSVQPLHANSITSSCLVHLATILPHKCCPFTINIYIHCPVQVIRWHEVAQAKLMLALCNWKTNLLQRHSTVPTPASYLFFLVIYKFLYSVCGNRHYCQCFGVNPV